LRRLERHLGVEKPVDDGDFIEWPVADWIEARRDERAFFEDMARCGEH
jgi:hypothetical protein